MNLAGMIVVVGGIGCLMFGNPVYADNHEDGEASERAPKSGSARLESMFKQLDVAESTESESEAEAEAEVEAAERSADEEVREKAPQDEKAVEQAADEAQVETSNDQEASEDASESEVKEETLAEGSDDDSSNPLDSIFRKFEGDESEEASEPPFTDPPESEVKTQPGQTEQAATDSDPVEDAKTQDAAEQSSAQIHMVQPPIPQPLTLDELIRQAHTSKRVRDERVISRLAEKERVAVALKATLDAAQEVANFGQAGSLLLDNANLDDVVEAMIIDKANQEREAKQALQSVPTQTRSTLPVEPLPMPVPAVKQEDDFDAWEIAWVRSDENGVTASWRNANTSERVVLQQGERWHVGDDQIEVIASIDDERGRGVLVNVNGEERRALVR